jgi:glycine/D-amino acid oxidase-like deaminating enzyme
VAKLEEESGLSADLRREGTIYLSQEERPESGRAVSAEWLEENEPAIPNTWLAYRTEEGSVDPRALMAAATEAAKKNGVVISHEHPVSELETSGERVAGVRVGSKTLSADVVVNCAGAWAGEIAGVAIPSLPVKGQMLAVVDTHKRTAVIRHVVRGDEVYLVPRSDGRILIGATVEHAGFDKRVEPEMILRMKHEAVKLVPHVADMRIQESWAGLRPGSPDKLPMLGKTSMQNYFVATGHYRNGILLAPITAQIIADMICGGDPEFDLSKFSLKRFSTE